MARDMGVDQWAVVDRYIADELLSPDPVLDEVLAANQAAGLPPHDVSPTQGMLLHLLARIQRAEKVLEIGTLGGYSTIWLARALPTGGSLLTIEANPSYAEVARANIERAGLTDRVDIRVGHALEVLEELAAARRGPFDLIFIDADKANDAPYFDWALELSRSGSVIIGDNVVRGGSLVDTDSADPRVQGVRRLHELIATEPRVDATTIQTVGSKGYDGFLIALVTR